MNCDVLIIGGGLSGLTAAREILSRSPSTTVMIAEARSRVGGRTLTLTATNTSVTWCDQHTREFSTVVDVGAGYMGETQKHLIALAKEAGIESIPVPVHGTHVQDVAGRLGTYAGSIPSLGVFALIDMQIALLRADSWANAVDAAAPWEHKDAAWLDGMTAVSFAKELFWTEEAYALFEVGVRATLSVEPSEVSALFLLKYAKAAGGFMQLFETEGGAQHHKFKGGTLPFSVFLANKIRQAGGTILLDAPVDRIEWTDASALVHLRGGEIVTAKRCIVAMSPRLAGLIRFSPMLPPAREEVMASMPMGSIIKTHMFYETPWWTKAGKSGLLVSDVGPICAAYSDPVYTDKPMHVLMGFLLAKDVRKWRDKPLDERRQAIADQYARVYGCPELAAPAAYDEFDWNREEFSRGCYTGVSKPGMLTQVGQALTKPCGAIHWAGTETSPEWCGYMEGALVSGKNAGIAVLATLTE